MERVTTVPSSVWDHILNIDLHVHQSFGLSFFHAVACRLFSAKPLFETMLTFGLIVIKFTEFPGTMDMIEKLQVKSLFMAFAEPCTKGHSTDTFVHAHSTTLEGQKKRLSAISIIETEWSTYASPKQGHCWFRQWLVTCLMPSHYLNQCRIISEIKIELRQISLRKVTKIVLC